MKLDSEYSQNIIVGVLFRGHWSWYVTEKEIWFLDLTKFPNTNDHDDYPDRFNIPIVNEDNAEQFLRKIKEFEANHSELTELMVLYEQVAEKWDDISELCPSLFVDFDNKTLYSLFPEPASFEYYVPEGCSGFYKDFLDLVPHENRYWVVNQKNLLEVVWKLEEERRSKVPRGLYVEE